MEALFQYDLTNPEEVEAFRERFKNPNNLKFEAWLNPILNMNKFYEICEKGKKELIEMIIKTDFPNKKEVLLHTDNVKNTFIHAMYYYLSEPKHYEDSCFEPIKTFFSKPENRDEILKTLINETASINLSITKILNSSHSACEKLRDLVCYEAYLQDQKSSSHRQNEEFTYRDDEHCPLLSQDKTPKESTTTNKKYSKINTEKSSASPQRLQSVVDSISKLFSQGKGKHTNTNTNTNTPENNHSYTRKEISYKKTL